MYEELVKRLRAECVLPYSAIKDMRAAADAIEKLSAYVRQIEELRKDGYYLQKTKISTYGQAIKTMPLPQPPKEE